MRPYRTSENKIEGLVVALLDIDQLRRNQQELQAARDFARSVIQGVPLPLAVVDREFRIRVTNHAFSTITGLPNQDLERRFLPDLAAALWGLENQLRGHLESLRNTRSAGKSFSFEHVVPGEDSKAFCVRGCVLQPEEEQFLLITIEDITSHKKLSGC